MSSMNKIYTWLSLSMLIMVGGAGGGLLASSWLVQITEEEDSSPRTAPPVESEPATPSIPRRDFPSPLGSEREPLVPPASKPGSLGHSIVPQPAEPGLPPPPMPQPAEPGLPPPPMPQPANPAPLNQPSAPEV